MENNNEEIQLEYADKTILVLDSMRKRITKVIIISIVSMIMLFILKILEIVFGLVNNVILMIIAGIIIGICVVLALSWNYTIYNKKNTEQIKQKGKKEKAEIINLQKYEEWNFYHEHHPIVDIYDYDKKATLVLSYQGETVRVGPIKVNKAYRILKLLLEPYPIKGNDKICIDIYEYKNFIYVDLESLQLEKINGYEEAIKLIEESIK